MEAKVKIGAGSQISPLVIYRINWQSNMLLQKKRNSASAVPLF